MSNAEFFLGFGRLQIGVKPFCQSTSQLVRLIQQSLRKGQLDAVMIVIGGTTGTL